MQIKFPPFLKKNPFEIFQKIEKPLFAIIIIGMLMLRAWYFGNSTSEKGFVPEVAFGGLFATEIIIAIVFLVMGGTRLSQLARFVILYSAFMPKIKFLYLERMSNLKLLFEVRDDFTNGRLINAIALWYPELTGFLVMLVPFIIVLIISAINGDENMEVKISRKTFVIMVILIVLNAFLSLPFANFTNIGNYVISFILVSGIWKLWEGIRRRKSLEPMPVVAWAEILLFLALFLKGIVES